MIESPVSAAVRAAIAAAVLALGLVAAARDGAGPVGPDVQAAQQRRGAEAPAEGRRPGQAGAVARGAGPVPEGHRPARRRRWPTLPKGDPMADPSGASELSVDARQHAQARIAALPPEARALYRSPGRRPGRAVVSPGRGRARPIGPAQGGRPGVLPRRGGTTPWTSWATWRSRTASSPRPWPCTGSSCPTPRAGAAGSPTRTRAWTLARVAAKKLLCRAALGADPPTADRPGAVRRGLSRRRRGRSRVATGRWRGAWPRRSPGTTWRCPRRATADGPRSPGRPTRTQGRPGPIDVGQFQWRMKLEPPPAPARPAADRPGRSPAGWGGRPGGATDAPLPFHPIVLGDQVIVCDEGRILAFHLNARPDEPRRGRRRPGRARGVRLGPEAGPSQLRPSRRAAARPAVHAHGLGRPHLRPAGPLGPRGAGTLIVAVRNNREIEGKRLWEQSSNEVPLPRARPDAPDRFTGDLRGLARGRRPQRLHRPDRGRRTEIAAYVACLDAETGAVRWVKPLGTRARRPRQRHERRDDGRVPGSAEIGNRLLSLDGQTVYYQTNLGAVAALDAETGAIQWLATYPTRDRPASPASREPNPAVVHDGLVIVAPDDSPCRSSPSTPRPAASVEDRRRWTQGPDRPPPGRRPRGAWSPPATACTRST